MLESVLRGMAPSRIVAVELTLGFVSPRGLTTVPAEHFQWLLSSFPDPKEPVVVVTVRNQGGLTAFVEGYGIAFHPFGSTLIGYNDFPSLNPSLPKRLDSGESGVWVTKMATVVELVKRHRAAGAAVERIGAEASLASGEKVVSDEVPVEPLLGSPD